MIVSRLAFLAVAVTMALAPAAHAATGSVVGVMPAAELETNSGLVVLQVGTDVQTGQTVVTGPAGQAELIFTDGTKLVVGPSSKLLLEDYLLRTDGTPGKLAINMLGGTFRFFTGSMPKSSYTLQTPSGTIGIRGTILEIYVNEAGNALVALLEGGADLCPSNLTTCTPLNIEKTEACSASFLALNATGFSEISAGFFRIAFPYLVSQETLQEQFRVGTAAQCLKELTKFAGATSEPEEVSKN